MPTTIRTGRLCLLAVIAGFSVGRPVSAATIYATSITSGEIFTVDTVTHTVTPFLNVGHPLDSLFFDPSGRIVYSELDDGTIAAFNPTTHTTVNLATGLTAPIDMTLDPSQTTLLFSDSTSHLVRVSLAGGVVGSLNVGSRPDGVVYDASGRLFVNTSGGFTDNNSIVKQIDPVTGAVLHQTSNTGVFLDGLTYDSFTGKLFASDYNNGRIVEVDPNTLAFSILTPTGAALSQPDGITSDGLGHLFIASRGNSQVIEYNIGTNAAVSLGTIAGLDDLAPASGLGSNSVPAPSSLVMAITFFAGLSMWALRQRRQRQQSA